MVQLFWIAALARKWGRAVFAWWQALPVPMRLLVFLVIGALAGNAWGKMVEAQRCRETIERSVADAKALDIKIARDAAARAERQRDDASLREKTTREEIADYVSKLSEQTSAACLSGRDADRFNDGVSVSDDPLPKPGERPSRNERRDPEEGSVPKGPEK